MSDIITSVYGGKATITFKPARHVYTVAVPSRGIQDLWQPGVTSIIGMKDKSGALVPWAIDEMCKCYTGILDTDPNPTISKEMCKAVLKSAKETWRSTRDTAATIGTFVHNYLEAELNHRSGLGSSPRLPQEVPAEMRERVENSISAGLKFFDKHDIKLVQAESPRWSAEHGYVGTGDLIAYVDGELSVLDYKTSKRLYTTVFLQLSAYKAAFEEEHPGQEIVKRVGINVCRDGSLVTESRDNSTHQTDMDCFLALLRLWRWSRENDGDFSKPAPMVVGRIN